MINISNFIKLFLFIVLFNQALSAKEIKQASDEDIDFLLNNVFNYDRQDWLGAYVQDQNGTDIKIGYTNLKIETTKNENDENFLIVKLFFVMNFKNYGADYILESSMSEIFQADPPYNFLNSSSYSVGDKITNSTITTLTDDKLTYLELDNDKKIQLENLNVKYRLNDFLIFESLAIKDNLKEGDIYYSYRIDKDKLITDENTIVEVNNVTIDGVKQKYYKIKYSEIIDGEQYENIIYGNEEKIISFNMDLGDGFIINFRLESKEEATDLSYVADLYILNSIHLNKNFHKPAIFEEIFEITESENTYLDYLNFEVTGEFDESFDYNYIHQQVIKENNKIFINLGYNSDFIHEKVSENYYEEVFDFAINNPKLVTIANEATSSSSDQYDKLEQLMIWINDNTSQYAASEEITDPYEILNRGGGDCTEITELFNSLAKSLGIPARSVTGYVFSSEDYSFGGHQWSEVEIDGNWVPVDATWNMWVEYSPYHIKVKDFSKTSENFTKKFKLNLSNAQFSNGKIINYKEDGTKITN